MEQKSLVQGDIVTTEIELTDDNKVIFKKATWYNEEIDVANSLYIREKDGAYIADLTETSKEALFHFMQFCFGNFVREDKWKRARELLYSRLKDAYDGMYQSFDKALRTLPYYDELYEHQKEGVFTMCNRRHNLLSFEQGLGKSVTSISLTLLLDFKKTLIVCPAICKWNWYHELMKWGVADDEITIVDAKQSKNSTNEKFIIINYDILDKFNNELMSRDIQHLICDEVHYIKNVQTKRYKAIKRIVVNKKPKISLLTGTPIKNRPVDLFAYMKLVSHPMGSNYNKFVERYTFYHDTQWGRNIIKGKNLRELSTKLSNFIIRKTKEECLDLPKKVVTKYHFELDDYVSEYNTCLKEIVKKNDTSKIAVERSIHLLNIITAKSKIKSIIKLVNDLIYEDKKVVIFSSYKEPLRMLKEEFENNSVLIDGSVPTHKRHDLIEKFKTDDDIKIFLGNMVAAGVGINLENANDVIFVNFPFTVAELSQAVDRTHRIGQQNMVNVYYTICKGTVDEVIYRIIANKAEDINEVLNEADKEDFNNVPTELFKELLSEYERRERA